MAESVDALVSNTSRFTPVPVRPRLWVQGEVREDFSFFVSAQFGSVWGRSVGGVSADLLSRSSIASQLSESA